LPVPVPCAEVTEDEARAALAAFDAVGWIERFAPTEARRQADAAVAQARRNAQARRAKRGAA